MMRLLGLFLLISSSIFGEEAAPLGGQGYNYWEEFVNMLITLAVILVLVGLSVWFLKRFNRSRLRNLNSATGIKVLERRALNQKASLYLIDVLGKGVVISESQAGGIQVITEFPDGTNVSLLLEEKQELEPPKVTFKGMLQRKMRRMTKRHESSS